MRKTLADVYADQHDRQLRHVARYLFWDWQEAAQIAREARERLEAKREKIEAEAAKYDDPKYHDGVLRGAVSWAFTQLLLDRREALGYKPPEIEEGIRTGLEILELGEEWAAAERAERAELLGRIDTLPAALREPMGLWLDDQPIPESLGWSVRQGLTLLGRRRAAA